MFDDDVVVHTQCSAVGCSHGIYKVRKQTKKKIKRRKRKMFFDKNLIEHMLNNKRKILNGFLYGLVCIKNYVL